MRQRLKTTLSDPPMTDQRTIGARDGVPIAPVSACRAPVPDTPVRSDLDVVLLSADSLETVTRVHSGYFDSKVLDALQPA